MGTSLNRRWFNVASAPGSGDVAVGSALAGYLGLGAAQGGMTFDGVTFLDGSAWEVRNGCTYTHGTTTLSRGTLEESSTGSAISLSSSTTVMLSVGAAQINALERLLKFGAARAKGTGTNQVLSSLSTFTQITCLTEAYDEAGFWNNTTKVYKPTVAGRYLIAGQASIDGIDGAKRMILRIGIDPAGGASLSSSNDQSYDLFRGFSSVAAGFVGGAGSAVVVADGTLSIGLMAWQDSSAAAALNAQANLCNFHATYLGPVV